MSSPKDTSRIVRVFRYDPAQAGEGRFERYELDIQDESLTTVLDVLIRIQKEQDPSLAFRYACRVSMCGSCAMVINGRERLACKTVVGDLKQKDITIRPLNHFPVVKDLVVDMGPFFDKYEKAAPFFEPTTCRASAEAPSCGCVESAEAEPAVIRPDSRERQAIGLATECIACGCCVSSCTMAHYHDDYVGPAALNRAFTLLADSRDGLHAQRMHQILQSCYNCRLEFNCTEVCPKDISPTRAIKHIHRMALKAPFRKPPEAPKAERKAAPLVGSESVEGMSRRRFLKGITWGLGTATGLAIGGVLVSAAVGPSIRKEPRKWIQLGKTDEFPAGAVRTVNVGYEAVDGFYRSREVKPIIVARQAPGGRWAVFNSRCTHLGCTIRWDEGKRLFVCACHGGAFDVNGDVKAGPPPRPMDRYAHKIEDGNLLVEV